MNIEELLQQAFKTGEPITITTGWSEYEDAMVTSVDDKTVEFTATHPLKGGEYDFAFQYSSIDTVQFN